MKHVLTFLILAAFTIVPARAEDVTHILTELESDFLSGSSTTSLAKVTSLAQSVTGAYSAAGDVVCTITLLAPEGKLIRFTTPEGFTTYSFSARAYTENASEGDGETATVTPSFIRPGGDIPTLMPDDGFMSDDPAGYAHGVADNTLVAGQTFTFKGVRLVVEVPAAYSQDFMDNAFGEVRASAFSFDSVPDPGLWAELIDDPLPIAQRAALTAKIKKLRKALKRAKKRGPKSKIKRLKRKIKKLQRQLAAL